MRLWERDIQPWASQALHMAGCYLSRGPSPEGIALLYDTRRFRLLRQRAVRFRELVPAEASAVEGE